jgi:hypothetical protein
MTKSIIQKSIIICFGICSFNSVYGQNSNAANIQCDDSLWNRVYHSYRLVVLEKCKRVTGLVVGAKFEADGDAHLQIKVDSGQENLLNAMNYEKQNGYLVVEPVCATLIDGKNPKSECDGYVNKVYLPQMGEHVEIIGSLVLDTKHSWNEIHPATSITPLKN